MNFKKLLETKHYEKARYTFQNIFALNTFMSQLSMNILKYHYAYLHSCKDICANISHILIYFGFVFALHFSHGIQFSICSKVGIQFYLFSI